MKFISIFTKTPQNRKFSYTPRYYDSIEDERRSREERIRKELNGDASEEPRSEYSTRIAGSFRKAQRTSRRSASSPSVGLLRLVILTFLVLMLIGIFEFGRPAIYGFVLLVPFYFYLKFRRPKN